MAAGIQDAGNGDAAMAAGLLVTVLQTRANCFQYKQMTDMT